MCELYLGTYELYLGTYELYLGTYKLYLGTYELYLVYQQMLIKLNFLFLDIVIFHPLPVYC